MELAKVVSKWIGKTTQVAATLSNTILFFTMAMIVLLILFRVIGIGISGVPSLSEILFVICIYLSIAKVQRTKVNIAVDLVIAIMPQAVQQVLRIIQLIIPLAFCAIIVCATWKFAFDSWQIREATDGEPFFPIYPAKMAVAIGITLLLCQLLVDFLVEMKLSVSAFRRKNRKNR